MITLENTFPLFYFGKKYNSFYKIIHIQCVLLHDMTDMYKWVSLFRCPGMSSRFAKRV